MPHDRSRYRAPSLLCDLHRLCPQVDTVTMLVSTAGMSRWPAPCLNCLKAYLQMVGSPQPVWKRQMTVSHSSWSALRPFLYSIIAASQVVRQVDVTNVSGQQQP